MILLTEIGEGCGGGGGKGGGMKMKGKKFGKPMKFEKKKFKKVKGSGSPYHSVHSSGPHEPRVVERVHYIEVPVAAHGPPMVARGPPISHMHQAGSSYYDELNRHHESSFPYYHAPPVRAERPSLRREVGQLLVRAMMDRTRHREGPTGHYVD